MTKVKENGTFIKELINVNPYIKPLEKYKGARTKILVQCLIDGYQWMSTPTNLLRGKGCPECKRLKHSTFKISSQKDFRNLLDTSNRKNNTFWDTHDTYVDSNTKLHFFCKKDDFQIYCTFGNLLSGNYVCKECKRKEYENKLKQHIIENELPIILDGDYKGSDKPIACICKMCGRKYYTLPNRIISNNVICRKCAYIQMGINSRVSFDIFINKLSKNNPDITYLSGYEGMESYVSVRCNKCGYEWSVLASSIANSNSGCPKCHLSKGETRISKYLDDNNIKYISQKTFDNLRSIKKLRYDFYIPQYNCLIEYQGIQHEKIVDFSGNGIEYAEIQFKKGLENDEKKRKFALENKIKLLEIWYYDFNNIEKILDRTFQMTS